jgi:hypothetical protein
MIMLGCSSPRVIDGVTHRPAGIFSASSPDIYYEVNGSDIILTIVTIETVVIPIYIVGWDILEPACKKSDYTPGVGCRER